MFILHGFSIKNRSSHQCQTCQFKVISGILTLSFLRMFTMKEATAEIKFYRVPQVLNRQQSPRLCSIRGGGGRENRSRREDKAVKAEYGPERASTESVWKPFRMYTTCLSIVSVWILVGTLFYSWFNEWPLAQSFFYAVDAGMSIGFCTDVKETKVASRAFTIVFILLGASCVGGALALFIQDAVEGLANTAKKEYQLLLEKDAFFRADRDGSGKLSFDEFKDLVQWRMQELSPEAMQKLCEKFDSKHDGVIHYEEFIGRYRRIDKLVQKSSLHGEDFWIQRGTTKFWEVLKLFCQHENRIYFVFALWMALGIGWGILDQNWDPITSTHFAVSALATGGLTAPHVGTDGILPVRESLFVGVYCLFGIPLFALTLGHFARVLVEGHVKAAEYVAITKPLSLDEFEFAKSICTNDSVMHLSDFIVLQLLRQGKINAETVQLLKKHFEKLDIDNSGVLTLEEATGKR